MSKLADLDPRFFVEHALLEPGEDSHEVGRVLAARAAAHIGGTLAYDGTRPLAVLDTPAHETWPVLAGSLSITHTRTHVFAVSAKVSRLGIDLVDYDDARIERIAARFLGDERDAIDQYVERLLVDGQDGIERAIGNYVASANADQAARAHALQQARAMCFAAKEAGLKAMGLGLLDGGVIDGNSPVRIESLDPPRYAAGIGLELALYDVGLGALAIAHG